MALIQRRISGKKQITLIIVMVLVLLVTLSILYFGLWKKPAPVARPQAPILKNPQGVLTPGAKSGLEALEELQKLPAAQKLRKFGTWPLSVEPHGRRELFAAPDITNE